MKKFKVGDLIKGKYNFYGVTNHEMSLGKVISLTGNLMNVKILNHENKKEIENDYNVANDDELFELITKPTKQEVLDLPLGSRITTDYKYVNNNTFYKVGKLDFCNNDCDHIIDNDINEDLSLNSYGDHIIKIEKPTTWGEIYNKKDEPKEMTIAEISKALGYEVKIIKE